MRKTSIEASVIYPEGYEDDDILLCDYTITGYSGDTTLRWLFCKANGNLSITTAVRKAKMAGKVVKKIVIIPIKKIGEKNP